MRSREDVPELMQQIQSYLPVKEAARTSVLSKSWLHAWSTIPALRFDVRKIKLLNVDVVDRTLDRYIRDNIPIERFDLDILIENEESASLVEKWIRSVATNTCLKELSLSIDLFGASLVLPYEILSRAENLTKLRVEATRGRHSVWMKTSSHHPPIINCVSLREVVFAGVSISQEVLDGILSSCSLLVKIKLRNCSQLDLKTIKVKDLPCLYKLSVILECENATAVEVSHVSNLRVFHCVLGGGLHPRPSTVCSFSLGSSVTDLRLGGLITNDASLDIIKSGSPFLESLNLDMGCWTLGSFRFTCASLKRLSLLGCPRHGFIDIQVYAPKLLFFLFGGCTMPSLLFPVSTLYQTTFRLTLNMPPDASFFS